MATARFLLPLTQSSNSVVAISLPYLLISISFFGGVMSKAIAAAVVGISVNEVSSCFTHAAALASVRN
jgi:hypothetical protein